MKREHEKRRSVILSRVSVCVCVVLIVAAAVSLSFLSEGAGIVPGNYGSLILTTSHMGWAVIGVLAFLLGVCVTLLCVRLRDAGDRWDK
ncbi:MAG: hypothetical protein IKR51_08165 [Oscillospiraceae bacterium]|nr:hypothetical protein [Oscillospiraceae bacterium]